MRIRKDYTWAELVAEAKRPCPFMDPSSEDCNSNFRGTRDYAENMALLTAGWKEGADKIEHGLQTIGATHNAPSYRLDVAGAFPHPGIAASGDPACMFCPGDETKPRPSLTLVCTSGCNSNVTAESVYLCGLALCSVIDGLEQSGTRVELIAQNYSKTERDSFHFFVMLKELHQPLDLYRIAFVFCNASYHRRTTFRLQEIYMGESWCRHGYGRTTDPDRSTLPPGCVFVPAPGNVANLDAAKARLTELIDKAQAE